MEIKSKCIIKSIFAACLFIIPNVVSAEIFDVNEYADCLNKCLNDYYNNGRVINVDESGNWCECMKKFETETATTATTTTVTTTTATTATPEPKNNVEDFADCLNKCLNDYYKNGRVVNVDEDGNWCECMKKFETATTTTTTTVKKTTTTKRKFTINKKKTTTTTTNKKKTTTVTPKPTSTKKFDVDDYADCLNRCLNDYYNNGRVVNVDEDGNWCECMKNF